METGASAVRHGLEDLEQAGCAHAATDAHCDHCMFGSAPPTLKQHMSHLPTPGHSKGMTDCNGPAVHIHLLMVDPKHFCAAKGNHGKGFV
mmetsp:Transcript_30677/g.65917  ORF Transcript_30677/g.65917 Transcript_30677/m.65917 type:complete len:90 (-) Transcript_30677:1016-1285(-)